VEGGSRVRLRPLCQRRDGDGWVIGRMETGDFVSVPAVGQRAITLLSEGHAVDEVAARLRAETRTSFAVADFVRALDELGFVAEVDEQVRADAVRPGPSLPRLRPGHVRWMLDPLMPAVVAGFAVAAVVMLVLHPALIPSYRVLNWSRHAGLVIAVDAAIAWTIVALHELSHLATARAAGVPARITLSTRLQFLTAQTDVSGVWAAPRRTRMTVYLAGMSADVCNAAVCLLILGLADPHGLVRRLLAVAVAEALLALPFELMVFMRTDVYFVLQDLTGCANLYADGSACLRRLAGRVRGKIGPDPLDGYSPPQRRAVRAYSAVLVAGTALSLGVEIVVSVPLLFTLVLHAAGELTSGGPALLDGLAALAILLAWQALWVTRWWHRHRRQVRAIARRHMRGEVTGHGRHHSGTNGEAADRGN